METTEIITISELYDPSFQEWISDERPTIWAFMGLLENKQKTSLMTIDYIKKVVCEYFNQKEHNVFEKGKKSENCTTRQIAMYFCKQLTNKSFNEIGKACGNKDHATVLHACEVVNNLCDTDKKFKQKIEAIEKLLK